MQKMQRFFLCAVQAENAETLFSTVRCDSSASVSLPSLPFVAKPQCSAMPFPYKPFVIAAFDGWSFSVSLQRNYLAFHCVRNVLVLTCFLKFQGIWKPEKPASRAVLRRHARRAADAELREFSVGKKRGLWKKAMEELVSGGHATLVYPCPFCLLRGHALISVSLFCLKKPNRRRTSPRLFPTLASGISGCKAASAASLE